MKYFFWLLSAVYCTLSFLWLCKAMLLGYYPDFNTQYYVPHLVFAGHNPYLGGSGLYTPQVYPPTEFIFFLPFSLLPLKLSSYLYTALSILSLIASLFLLAKIFNVKFLSKINLLLMGLVFMMFPVKFTLGMGQINLLVLWLMVYGLWLMKKRKEFCVGVVLGVSLVIKLFPILLPVWILVSSPPATNMRSIAGRSFHSNGIRIILGIAFALTIAIVFVLIFIPWEVNLTFLKIFPSLLSSWKLDYYNQSLGGFIGRSWGTDELATILKQALSVTLILTTFFVVLKNRKPDIYSTGLIFGSLINLNLIVNTFSWQHHFVWLIIPFYSTFFYLRKIKAKNIYYLLLTISYLLISINFKDPSILPTLFQSHVLFGGLILLGLDLYLLVDRKRQ